MRIVLIKRLWANAQVNWHLIVSFCEGGGRVGWEETVAPGPGGPGGR